MNKTPPAFTQLKIQFDTQLDSVWLNMDATPCPCFNATLVQELNAYQQMLQNQGGHWRHNGELHTVHTQVIMSANSQVFSYGGDLALFLDLIEQGDRDRLLHYAHTAIDVTYANVTSYGLPLITIALVRGQAIGGGFETALANKIIVSERSATFSFPEIMFNHFPGMGAYPLLMRRVPMAMAEKIILSGKKYSAEELFDVGIVDILADDGAGEDTVRQYILQQAKRPDAYQAVLNRMSQRLAPFDLNALRDICEMWVDNALNLREQDRRAMRILVKTQKQSNDL
jgi:DSF synthase